MQGRQTSVGNGIVITTHDLLAQAALRAPPEVALQCVAVFKTY